MARRMLIIKLQEIPFELAKKEGYFTFINKFSRFCP